jgi:hypothetical protein
MAHQQVDPPARLPNILEGNEQINSTPLGDSKLYPKPSIRLPFCKFVSVRALLDMEMVLPYDMMPESSFVSRVHFAVSHRWQSPYHPDQDGSTRYAGSRRFYAMLRECRSTTESLSITAVFHKVHRDETTTRKRHAVALRYHPWIN